MDPKVLLTNGVKGSILTGNFGYESFENVILCTEGHIQD